MPDHEQIYNRHAERYELLVSREDYQGHLLPALRAIAPLDELDAIELGAGTGRLTAMLAPLVRTLHAFDASAHMLGVAAAKLRKGGWRNWRLAVADHRSLPVADRVADVAVSGWSICYLVVGSEGAWREQVGHALAEMKRVLRPGGTAIILETLGTGHETPHPPDALAAYYAFLEAEGFVPTWIRTDYRFASLAEAEALTRFFFGDDLAAQAVRESWVVLPECTGLWWLKVPL
jgi:ubiquinone/menaquinone biosynthesis C-methylase UbiE